jgi:hypothetical protein
MEIDAFRRDGFLVVKDLFSGEMRVQLEALRDQILAGIEAGTISRDQQFAGGAIPNFDNLALHPPMVSLAHQILGDVDLSLYLPRILMKDSGYHVNVLAH